MSCPVKLFGWRWILIFYFSVVRIRMCQKADWIIQLHIHFILRLKNRAHIFSKWKFNSQQLNNKTRSYCSTFNRNVFFFFQKWKWFLIINQIICNNNWELISSDFYWTVTPMFICLKLNLRANQRERQRDHRKMALITPTAEINIFLISFLLFSLFCCLFFFLSADYPMHENSE